LEERYQNDNYSGNVLVKTRGKGAGGNEVRMKYALNGYRVERTGRGHDFVSTRDDILIGRRERLFIEAKSGPNSRLSKLQKKTKRKTRNYRVERVDPFFF